MDDERTTKVGAAVYDICEYLADLADDGRLDTGFGPIHQTAIYHPVQVLDRAYATNS